VILRREMGLNGVIVLSAKMFDSVVLWRVTQRNPENYESAIVEGLSQNTKTGDTDVTVGDR